MSPPTPRQRPEVAALGPIKEREWYEGLARLMGVPLHTLWWDVFIQCWRLVGMNYHRDSLPWA